MTGLTFTIIGDIFSPAERGRYQGVFSGAWGVASVFGPTLGGWIVDMVGWRAIFLLNVPIAAAAGYLAWKYVDERKESRPAPLDIAGAVLFTAAIGSLRRV